MTQFQYEGALLWLVHYRYLGGWRGVAHCYLRRVDCSYWFVRSGWMSQDFRLSFILRVTLYDWFATLCLGAFIDKAHFRFVGVVRFDVSLSCLGWQRYKGSILTDG